MAMNGRRIFFWLVLAVLLGAGLVYAFWPRPVPVDLDTVTRGPLRVTIDEEGETRVKDVYLVSAPLAGRLTRIEGEVGDPVKAGETVLATILPEDPSLLDPRSEAEKRARVKAAEAARALAQAEVQRVRAELDFARNELARAELLAKRGHISERALESADLEVKTHEAALASARAALEVKTFELETARAALMRPGTPYGNGTGEKPCCVEVRAPVDGRILKIIQESETLVAGGAPLLEIGDPASLEIVVDLLSSDAVKVREGGSVLIEEWGGAPLRGRVRRVEPYGFTKISALGIEEQRVNVIIDLDDPREAWQRLGHGYRVEVRIVIWEAEAVLQLPVSALFREGDAWAVFAEAEGVAEKRQVEIGHRNSLAAEVLGGLEEGEQVVLYPSDRVSEGTRIVQRTAEGI